MLSYLHEPGKQLMESWMQRLPNIHDMGVYSCAISSIPLLPTDLFQHLVGAIVLVYQRETYTDQILNDALSALNQRLVEKMSPMNEDEAVFFQSDFNMFHYCVRRLFHRGAKQPTTSALWPRLSSEERVRRLMDNVLCFCAEVVKQAHLKNGVMLGAGVQSILTPLYQGGDTSQRQEIQRYFLSVRGLYERITVEDERQPLAAEQYVATESSPPLSGSVIPRLERDLQRLRMWGRGCLLAYTLTIDSTVSAEDMVKTYVQTYERVQTRIQHWMALLFQIRQKKELRLRQETYYMDRLNELDTKLGQIASQMQGENEQWLKDLPHRFLLHPEIMEAATACLQCLHDPKLQPLKWAIWVQYSCFDFNKTEGYVCHEILQRNKNRKYFDLAIADLSTYMTKVSTMTDFAVAQLPALCQHAKGILVKLHPDKNPKALESVATFCTTQLTTLRGLAITYQRLWQRSQWADVATLTLESDLETEEAAFSRPLEHAEEPTGVLEISIFLSLKDSYLHSMFGKPSYSFQKQTRTVLLADRLYPCTVQIASGQLLWRNLKEQVQKTTSTHARMMEEKAELHETLAKYTSETQTLKQQLMQEISKNLLPDLKDRLLEDELPLDDNAFKEQLVKARNRICAIYDLDCVAAEQQITMLLKTVDDFKVFSGRCMPFGEPAPVPAIVIPEDTSVLEDHHVPVEVVYQPSQFADDASDNGSEASTDLEQNALVGSTLNRLWRQWH